MRTRSELKTSAHNEPRIVDLAPAGTGAVGDSGTATTGEIPELALRVHHRAVHRIVSWAVAAHLLLAFALAPIRGTFLAGMAGGIGIGLVFWAVLRLAEDRAACCHVASICLGCFAVLHAYQLPASVVVWSIPYTALVLLTFYEDPRCVWPGVSVVVAGCTALSLNNAERLESPTNPMAAMGIYVAGAVAASAGASLLRSRTRRAIERQRALAADNARLAAELAQSRQPLSESAATSEPKSPPPSGSGDRDAAELLQAAWNAAPDAMMLIDAKSGRLVGLNAKALELAGMPLDQLIDRDHTDLHAIEQCAFLRTVFRHAASGERRTVETKLIHRDGHATAVEATFSLVRSPQRHMVVAVCRDLTERKRADARRAILDLRHQELLRLEALHAMAAGVAHDFNNILMTILGFASIGRDRCQSAPLARSYFERIESATLRAGDVCRQMLTFAGRGQVAVRRDDLNATVLKLAPMLRAQLNPQVELEVATEPALPEIHFDAGALGKAMGSLFQNAIEAIGERPGIIHIRTRSIPAGDPLRDEGFITPELNSGPYVAVEIHDSGGGMAPHILPRIFEPFYSTKAIGRGLGLSEALGIIRAQQGAIQVISTPETGSTFRIYLPTVPTAGDSSSTLRLSPAENPHARLRNVALVIDDETSVRELVSSMVEVLGFTVYRAADGAEGLALFEQFGAQTGLVLLDLTMPGLPSHRVLEAIRESAHDVRVLIMSGYSERDVSARCGRFTPDGFLPKPFSLTELKRAIFGRETAPIPGRRGD